MSVTLPNLDDRRWVDLIDEGRALISLYAPQWNDHNIHDPGITFMELMAWIAEMDMYRVNRVTDDRRKKFLQLVGLRPDPAQPATTPVRFLINNDQLEFAEVPKGFRIFGTNAKGYISFETTETVHLSQTKLLSLARIESGIPVEIPLGLVSDSRPVAPFTNEPQDESVAYLGFSLPLPANRPTTLYISVPPGESESCVESTDGLAQHHSVKLNWEFYNSAHQWVSITPIVDTTSSLTRSGRVVFQPTEKGAKYSLFSQVSRPGARTGYFYLRVRIASGRYDKPPLVSGIFVHGVRAIQVDAPDLKRRKSTAVEGVFAIGVGNGEPNQHLKFSENWIANDELEIWTTTDDEKEVLAWQSQADFLASGMNDCHYILNSSTSTVTFGDGNQGRVVESGKTIWAKFRTTLGVEGNVPANTLDRAADFGQIGQTTPINFDLARLNQNGEPAILVIQPRRAVGGSDPETLANAVDRAVALVESPQRCVTLNDTAALAFQTPEVCLARVHVVANHYRPLTGIRAVGVITVVVVPLLPADRPVPTAESVNKIKLFLLPRRILGTRIEVVGPTFTKVSVRATVRACERVDVTRLQKEIVDSINEFLHPLRGGSENKGWEFGRDVYRSEMLQVIDQTLGVDHVLKIELLDSEGHPTCGNVCVPPTGLVESLPHEIEVVKAQ